jgi:aspartate/methionine/tyrosine aminotransferase
MFSRRTSWDLSKNRYTQALEAHREANRDLLDLTASNPTTVGLSYARGKLLRALASPDCLTYRPVAKGLLSAREGIAEYYCEKGSPVNPDALILTTSTSEAYSFVFRLLCDPGDAVLVPVPSYPLFDFLADLHDIELVPYELVYDHGWQIDFSSLKFEIEKAQSGGVRCRAVLVVHPNNPTGSYVKRHESEELNWICGHHDLAIIADEVFLDFVLGDVTPLTFSANDEVLTFTLSGLSKVAALPQMKVAWIAVSGPEALQREALERLEVIADTYLSMNAPVQLAVPEMLAERHSLQVQLLERVRKNLSTLDSQLATQNLCHRLSLEGGWYAILRVPALGSDEDLVIALLQDAGILLQPGHFYNFQSEGNLVASLITPVEEFRAGVDKALNFIACR